MAHRSARCSKLEKKLTPASDPPATRDLAIPATRDLAIADPTTPLAKPNDTPEPPKPSPEIVDAANDQPLAGSSFDLITIVLALKLVLQAANSLRSASKAIEIVNRLFLGRIFEAPAHNTIRNLLLRLGLFELTRAKDYLPDWVWVVDHTVQVGNQLCMVVLGIPLSKFRELGRPLCCTDMQVLELLPMDRSNGQIMGEHLTDLAQSVGVPSVIVSDEGSDIHGGFKALCRAEGTSPIRSVDIVHKSSRLIKGLLEQDEKWGEYRKQSCTTGNALRQTTLAHLKPPKPKTKARHMNLGPEIAWGLGVLKLLDGIEHNQNLNEQERAKLISSAGWLNEFRKELMSWAELMSLSEVVCTVVRKSGYHKSIAAQVKKELPSPKNELGRRFASKLLLFLEEQQSQCSSSGGSIPGSSEVIESLFGKGKRLEGQQSRSGFTAMLLAMAACVVKLDTETIREALSSVRLKHVDAWQEAFLGRSVQSKRLRDLGKSSCQEAAQGTCGGNPSFQTF